MNGNNIKYNDKIFLTEFFNSIKRNNGYLILGTSESGSVHNGNFYQFLNSDTTIKPKFSILSGAGRTAGVYLPVFINNKEAVDSLKVIYLINPVYWRTELAKLDVQYWNRYNNYHLVKNVQLNNEDLDAYNEVLKPYCDKLNPGQTIQYSMEYYLRKYRKPFFQNFSFKLNPEKFNKRFSYVNEITEGLNQYKNFGKVDTSEIDIQYNVTHKYLEKAWLNPIERSTDYRYKELEIFILFCKKYNVDITFLVAPYNGVFIKKFKPEYYDEFPQAMEKVIEILEREKVKYIDATDLSDITGTFIDNQHFSSYGAYLVYEKIKAYVSSEKDL
ncbi:MAG: hypothetical protein K9J13_05115 [Saprospiraceae bacterium]|nr:hypothetical protein [Saprospiraceae bacterium]